MPGLDVLYDTYSFQLIPPLGQIIAGDWDSYQYLVESIRQFPDQVSRETGLYWRTYRNTVQKLSLLYLQETFAEMIRDAGFGFVKHENLTGGIAAIHSGFKL